MKLKICIDTKNTKISYYRKPKNTVKKIKKREKNMEYGRNRYRNMTQEQKNKSVEYHREWINRQSEDKKIEIKKRQKNIQKINITS